MRVSIWLYWLQQTLSSLALTLAALRMLRLRLPAWKLLLCAAAGGAAALLAAMQGGGWLQPALLCLCCTMPAAALHPLPGRMSGPSFRAALLAGMIASSLCRLLAQAGLPALMVPAGAWGALMLRPPQRQAAPPCTEISLRRGANRVTLTALSDTGNLLRDPLTGLPVIVCARKAAAPLFPEGATGCPQGCRLISVHTVTGSAHMPLFRPDSLQVRTGHVWREARAVVGLAPEGYHGCQALLPAALFDQQGGMG